MNNFFSVSSRPLFLSRKFFLLPFRFPSGGLCPSLSPSALILPASFQLPSEKTSWRVMFGTFAVLPCTVSPQPSLWTIHSVQRMFFNTCSGLKLFSDTSRRGVGSIVLKTEHSISTPLHRRRPIPFTFRSSFSMKISLVDSPKSLPICRSRIESKTTTAEKMTAVLSSNLRETVERATLKATYSYKSE